jgi:hypothetical protein
MNAKVLQRTIQDLLDHQPDDLRLRDHLEGVRRDPALGALTWFWGPLLYRRNRIVFREFILAHFAMFDFSDRLKWKKVTWRAHADRLEPWLAEARRHRDTWLVRRLMGWKYAAEKGWGIDSKALRTALLADYRAAQTPFAQANVLEEYATWFELDEDTALGLYTTSPASTKYLLAHLPTRFSFFGGEKREMWRRLVGAAQKAGDDQLAFTLYRRQVDIKEWQTDVERLAAAIADPDQLNDELRKRHPEGWNLKLVDAVVALLEARGRDVLPYVREKLASIIGGFRTIDPEPLLKLAERRGWWDFWSAVGRTAADPKNFNRQVTSVLADASLDETARVERLRALAGVSREWNWPGLGLARVHQLEDPLATQLYRRYPQLVKGPFKPNVVPTWWQGGPQLLAAAERAEDEELVDLLASRYVTRPLVTHAWNKKANDETRAVIERLTTAFQALRDRDEATFARRAANILTQVPTYSIYSMNSLLETNDLARLFFVRSFSAFLASPASIPDLVEGSDIHVQMLAYCILAQRDPRAGAVVVESLDILLGTLLRPLHRKTRLAAFGALANAARTDAQAAARILKRAREALRLPDKKYPKEQLVGLIGQVLHARPELQGPRERPVVYGLEPVVA